MEEVRCLGFRAQRIVFLCTQAVDYMYMHGKRYVQIYSYVNLYYVKLFTQDIEVYQAQGFFLWIHLALYPCKLRLLFIALTQMKVW